MIDFEVDVLIVGGGLTGALLHIALKPSKISSLLIDRKDLHFNTDVNPENFDARSLALSSASIRILKNFKEYWKVRLLTFFILYNALLRKVFITKNSKLNIH